jgi:hypothetical protein
MTLQEAIELFEALTEQQQAEVIDFLLAFASSRQ